jgi:hypothetical protein
MPQAKVQIANVKIKKGPDLCRGPSVFSASCFGLAGDYVRRTWAFSALADLEFNFLAFIKIGVSAALDFRVMNEQIVAAIIWADKSKTFAAVKPFYCTCTHKKSPFGPLIGHKICLSYWLREYS